MTWLLLFIIISLPGHAATGLANPQETVAEKQWIDQTLEAMDLDQRIGQLLMIRAHSDKGSDYERNVGELIRQYRVGGILFFQGTAQRQAELTNQYQAGATIPLMVAMDAEWGLGMRLTSSTLSYPRALTLGAITDNELIYRTGCEIGRQCRRLGVHVNFAPVLDVNNNANNPVINDRSFGESPENVTSKGWAFIQGLQDQRVLACGKHFPGHGDTEVDSHYDLPVIAHDRQRLDAIELVPFRSVFGLGLGSVMVAHLNIPALDPRTNRPSTLSQRVVQSLLREEMQYEGLIFTDALEMKGVTKYFEPGIAEVEAFLAGNDVLLLPENVGEAVRALREAVLSARISSTRLDDSVRRILRIKHRLGLSEPQKVPLEDLDSDLNSNQARLLRQELLESSLVLVRNTDRSIPVDITANPRLATVAIGTDKPTALQQAVEAYLPSDHFQLPKDAENSRWTEMVKQLSHVEFVLASFHGLNRSSKANFGISTTDLKRLQRLALSKKVVVVHLGNPYGLANYDGLETVIQAFEESPDAQQAVAKAIFGEIPFRGTLPITASRRAQFGDGVIVRD